MLVPVLDEQPLAAASRADERPRSRQLLAEQHKLQLALGELAIHVGVVTELVVGHRRPHPSVPDHHGAAAVFALGNHALELVVVERVRLGLHGQSLDGRVERRSLRHGPREHHTAVLETEIVVELAGPVLLDDELARTIGGALDRPPRRLGRHGKVALAVVFGEPAETTEVGQGALGHERASFRLHRRTTRPGYPASEPVVWTPCVRLPSLR